MQIQDHELSLKYDSDSINIKSDSWHSVNQKSFELQFSKLFPFLNITYPLILKFRGKQFPVTQIPSD